MVEPCVTLLDLLRERLELTGTKKGCNYGECGACTVHLDGRRVNACMILAAQADGRDVTTVEGLAAGDVLHPVQQAFIDHDGFQCGFCTPGQIMSAVACIEEGHVGTEAEIREWMSGNLCRCSAYPQIVDAVKAAAAASGGSTLMHPFAYARPDRADQAVAIGADAGHHVPGGRHRAAELDAARHRGAGRGSSISRASPSSGGIESLAGGGPYASARWSS